MLKPCEHRAAHPGRRDEWNIEGCRLFTVSEWIGYKIPSRWIAAFEIDIPVWSIIRMHANVRVACIDQRLTTIATDRLEPITASACRFLVIRPGAIIL